jgi:hypothetical protein
MPKVDDASRIKEFKLDDNFQAEFDKWAAEVEKAGNGTLAITHDEVLREGTALLIFWKIQPNPYVARPRRLTVDGAEQSPHR